MKSSTKSMKDMQAWWSHKQGLDGSVAGRSAAEILKRCGWIRSVAGASPYLALFARGALRRQTVDAAAAAVEIHELPSARSCTYVLPASDYALGLAAGQPFADNELKLALRLGVAAAEIDQLRAAVLRSLSGGPLDPDSIREACGAAVRNLGAEGKKKGLATTLPVALGLLQSAGQIRRVPVNGRLDQQRYKYTRWNIEPGGTFTDLARRFFEWTGGATAAEFQTLSGLGVKAAKEAMAPLALELATGDLLMLKEDREEFESFREPSGPQYALVGSLDNIRRAALRPDIPNHLIVDRGRLVGLWDFDPVTATIVWKPEGKADAAMKEAVSKTEAYIREDLGDARSFSLDSPQSRIPRLEALRAVA